MKSLRTIGVLLLTLVATAALALKPGDPVWIKDHQALFFKEPRPNPEGLTLLETGSQGIWRGADPKNPIFQKVTFDGVTGYVLRTDLTPNRPHDDEPALQAAPAASKTPARSADPLTLLEEINDEVATSAAVAIHAKAAKLKVAK